MATPPPRDFEPLVQLTYETLLREGDVALDIGAHSGRHAIPMARRVAPHGKVFAFEPLPTIREGLAQKLADHHRPLADVLQIYPYALSNFSGESEFVVARDLLEYSGLRERNYDWPTRLEKIPIQVRRIDDLFLDLPALRYIKMDVEGGEYHVLQGALGCLQKFRPVVGFEFGGCAVVKYDVTPDDMSRFWAEQHYQVFDVTGRLMTPESFATSARCLDVWDYVAIPGEKPLLARAIVDALTRPSVNWALTTMNLNAAEQYVDAGMAAPPMRRFGPVTRPLARAAGRLLLWLGRVFTTPQRQFNGALVRSFRTLIEGLQQCDQRLEMRDGQVGQLEDTVNELRTQLAARDARLEQLERALADLQRQPGECSQVGRAA